MDLVFEDTGDPLPYPLTALRTLTPRTCKQKAGIRNRSKNKQTFFFMHIPKTAGTSFGKMLETLFSDRQVVKHYPYRWGLWNKKYEIINTDLLMGHLPFYCGRILETPPQTLVFLRDPVDRVVSFLQYVKQRRKKYHGLELSEIFDQEKTGVVNHQVRYFIHQKPSEDIPPDAIDAAKKQLAQFDFIGLTEVFENSVALAEHQFNWSFQKILYANQTHIEMRTGSQHKRDLIEPELLEKIENATRLDSELYAYGQTLFKARWEKTFQDQTQPASPHSPRNS